MLVCVADWSSLCEAHITGPHGILTGTYSFTYLPVTEILLYPQIQSVFNAAARPVHRHRLLLLLLLHPFNGLFSKTTWVGR